MKPGVNYLPFSDLPNISRGRGIVNYPIATKKIGARSLHSGITLIPPNTSFPPHKHNTEEQVTILQGTLNIVLDGGDEVVCSMFDSTFLAPGVQHELINASDEPVYAMVTYGSINVNRTLIETGETMGIGSDEDVLSD